MKLVLGLMIAIFALGCTETKDYKQERDQLRESNYNLQNSLSTCESKYESLASQVSGMVIVNPSKEEEKPSEPEYETVEYYIVDGTKCSNASLDNDTDISCGISFWGCKDGVIRRCMTNVKYHIKEEKQLIEQE